MTLIFILLSASLVWRLILRATAYPDFIPTRIKIIHALVLFYVLLYGWSGLNQLVWLLFHSQSSIWSRPPLLAAHVFEGLAGACLLFVCSGMAKRQKMMLRWFFLLWPVTFFSSSYVAIIVEQGVVRSQTIVVGMVLCVGIFIMTLAFYLRPSTKIIFEEVSHVV